MFKCEIIVYHNKTKSLKYENCFNVVHVSEKAHSSIKLLSIFCLMQGILLLASKKCSLTSQGLVQNVGAGMNCRALWRGVIKTSGDMQSIQLSKYQESVVLYEKSIIDWIKNLRTQWMFAGEKFYWRINVKDNQQTFSR